MEGKVEGGEQWDPLVDKSANPCSGNQSAHGLGFWVGTVGSSWCVGCRHSVSAVSAVFDVGGVGRESTNSTCLNAMQSYRSQVAAWGERWLGPLGLRILPGAGGMSGDGGGGTDPPDSPDVGNGYSMVVTEEGILRMSRVSMEKGPEWR